MGRMLALLLILLVSMTAEGAAQSSADERGRGLSGPPFRFLKPAVLKVSEGLPYTILIDEDFGYGWTGHVIADVHNTALLGKMKFKTPALTAGQPVYGVPMNYGRVGAPSPSFGTLFWCAPVRGKKRWTATCFSPADPKVTYSAYYHGLTVQSFLSNTAMGSEKPEVRPEEAPDLPKPLHITHRVGKWHKSYVEITTLVFVAGEPDGEGLVSEIPRDGDGAARFAVGGGEIRLIERPDGGFKATLVKDFTPVGSAMISSVTPSP